MNYEKETAQDSTSLSSHRNHGHSAVLGNEEAKYSYEWMHQGGKRYLCSIPVIETPPRNETSEAEARAEEAQEIARATTRGWELVQELDGPCLYYHSGYWSYSFCRNSEVKQFRSLPQQQGKPVFPPTEDPTVNSFILGKSVGEINTETRGGQDEWGNEIDVRKSERASSPTTELQMEGDTRYLVQKLEGGTLCDLTGKPRRVDVQYHCMPNVGDRIGRLKEITTCSYLLTIYTPRLCKDVAFVPPTSHEANRVICHQVVPQEEIANFKISTLEAAEQSVTGVKEQGKDRQIIVGGTVVGGNKVVGKEGQKVELPGLTTLPNAAADIIAKAVGDAEGGQVFVLSDVALAEMELDPAMVHDLREKMKKMAGDRGWTLELVEGPGNVKEIHGIVDDDGDGDDDDDDADDALTAATLEEAEEKGRSGDGGDGGKKDIKDEL